jgi:hypothetical protein
MAKWRFVTDDEDADLRTNPPTPLIDASGPDLEDLGIYKVVEGCVSPYVGGMTKNIAQVVPTGWFARVLEKEHEGYTYDGSGLRVEMHGNTVELKQGTLVTLFPSEHLEKARELSAPTTY